MAENETNLFGDLGNYYRVGDHAQLRFALREALRKRWLNDLFDDLFFRKQKLDILNICDYILDYYRERKGSAVIELHTDLDAYIAFLNNQPESYQFVIDKQVEFIKLVKQYVEIHEKSRQELNIQAERIVSRAITMLKFILPAQIVEVLASLNSELQESVLDTTFTPEYRYKQAVGTSMSHLQELIIQLLIHQDWQRKNDSLGQDPW